MPATPRQKPVSPNNPCPFLRALVAQGLVPDDVVPIGELTDTILDVARTGEGEPTLPAAAIRAVALAANGLGPLQLLRSGMDGVALNALRGGPLDKKGVGSGILDTVANVDAEQLDRLDQFASDHVNARGRKERGLDRAELDRMMDANLERAASPRLLDRQLMDGEWPILLQVMGKEGRAGRYLSVKEVRELFLHRRFPRRMAAALKAQRS